jgi:hypothetical protein
VTVGIATSLRLHELGLDCRQQQQIFLYSKNVQMIWDPPTLLSVGTEILSQGYSGRSVQPHFFRVKVKKRRTISLHHLQQLRALCHCNPENIRMTGLSTVCPSAPHPIYNFYPTATLILAVVLVGQISVRFWFSKFRFGSSPRSVSLAWRCGSRNSELTYPILHDASPGSTTV